MKRILLSAGILLSLSAAAQDKSLVENYLNRQLQQKLAAAKAAPLSDWFNHKSTDDQGTKPLGLQTSLAGEKMVYLPQDGMPCIQPDLRQFNMPNAGAGIAMKRSGAGVIPNPGNNGVTVLPKSKTILMKKP